MTAEHVIAAWDAADPAAIHPTRAVSEDAYWASGKVQADQLATVLPAGARVVDFGCGDGRVAIPLRALGYDVTGADSSQRMLDRLAVRDPELATVATGDVSVAELIGKKADGAYCLAVLIHHSYDDCEQVIAGLRAAVRANGLLVLDWPVSDAPSEAADWIGVTTWDLARQDDICRRVGLKRLDSDLPWGVFRAVKAA